jgi:hypothetical protein
LLKHQTRNNRQNGYRIFGHAGDLVESWKIIGALVIVCGADRADHVAVI